MNFFSLDSGFHKYGTMLFDLIALSIFWSFTTIFTIGLLAPLASTAMFNSINRTFIKEDGYMMASYFGTIKTKFLKSLGLTLVGLLLYGLSVFNLWSIQTDIFSSNFARFLMPLYLLILIEVTITMLYACALLTETSMNLKQLIKYGFLLSNKHLLVSLACVAGIVALGYLSIFHNLFFFFVGIAPLFWLFTWLIYKKVFTKYYLDKLA